MVEFILFTKQATKHNQNLQRTVNGYGSKPNSVKIKNSNSTVWYKSGLKHLYAKTVLWSLNLSYDKDFKLLIDKIDKFYSTQKDRRNLRMVFEYLKDCYTIISFRRAGKVFTSLKHHVSLDPRGIPRIIPYELRIRLDERVYFIAVSNILGIYRIIP